MAASLRTYSIIILAAIAALAAMHQARELVAPIVAAFLLGIVMTPLSDLWDKLRLPASLAALLSVLFALMVLLIIALLLEPYVTQAIQQGPVIRAELRETLNELRRLLRGLEEISEDVAAAIEPDGNASGDGDTDQVQLPSLSQALFYAPWIVGQLLIFTGTLYFFLLTRESVYHWLSKTIPTLGQADLRRAAGQVSRYVLTISAINLSFGALVAIAMEMIGMPSPVVWGLLAFLLNFLLYLGPACLVVTLTITGIVVFDGWASFLPPALYLAMNAVESQFVTPTLVGKSLAVNPLLVFLSLVFWLWLWGPLGGIIAIPLLIWTLTVVKSVTVEPAQRFVVS